MSRQATRLPRNLSSSAGRTSRASNVRAPSTSWRSFRGCQPASSTSANCEIATGGISAAASSERTRFYTELRRALNIACIAFEIWQGLDRRAGERLMSGQHIIDMTGKVALITGGSRGLGKAMGLGFAVAGAGIIVASRGFESCEEVARAVEKLGRRAMPYVCHVGRWNDCDALADAAYGRFGKVDILINNAGKSPLYDRPV